MLNFIDFDLKLPAYTHLISWTESAIECYERGCVCENCPIPHPTDSCSMKSFVLMLVKVLGNPNQAINRKLEQERMEQRIIMRAKELIESKAKKGWKKYLAYELNLPYGKVQYVLKKNKIGERI